MTFEFKQAKRGKAHRRLPTQLELWRIFEYRHEDGALYWKFRPDMNRSWNSRFAGKRAGNLGPIGYRTVSVNRVAYLEHRIIWQMCFCEEPDEIDHADLNRANNRLENLRSADRSENTSNRRGRAGRPFPKGVDMTPHGRYRATVRFRNKIYRLGHFLTEEEARAAYIKKATELHGEFARLD